MCFGKLSARNLKSIIRNLNSTCEIHIVVIRKVTWEVQDIIKLKKFKSKLFRHCRKKERKKEEDLE